MHTIRLSIGLATLAGALAAETTVLKNFVLIGGASRTPVAGSAMVVDNGRIAWVGPMARLKMPKGATTIDLAGKFVMPGIVNLHGHLGNVSGLTQDPKLYTRASVEQDLRRYASYGVTSVLSLGTDQPLIYNLRAQQRAGRPTFTRVFTAGRGFTGKGGYPSTVPGMKGMPYEVETSEDVVQDVKDLAGHRVDIVKIWVDDHLGKDKKIPLYVAKAIITEGHKHGIKVAAHVFYLTDAKELVNAGIDGLAHSVRDAAVDQELIDSMKKHGTWQMAATLTREESTFIFARTPAFLSDPFLTRSVDPAVLATLASPEYQSKIASDPDLPRYQGFLDMAERNLKRLADAGVRYGFGTDSGPPARFQGYAEHRELELMVQAGLTPAQAIDAATRSAAEFLGAQKDLGKLERGKWADLIVLAANPLDDIRNTRTIEAVYVAGNKVQ